MLWRIFWWIVFLWIIIWVVNHPAEASANFHNVWHAVFGSASS